jgi:phosphoglycolate phosphatase-like HAD superfamily hydrolase
LKDRTIFIFDCDGTILDSRGPLEKILKTLAKKFNVSLPGDAELKKLWGTGGYNLIKYCFPNYAYKKIYKQWKGLEHETKMELISGAEDTVKELKKSGFLVGLLTNRSQKGLRHYSELIQRLNFDFVQTCEYTIPNKIFKTLNPFKKHLTTNHFKPNPKFFRPFFKWLKRQRINPKEIFYIGDSTVDLTAIRSANHIYKHRIQFIGVSTGSIKTDTEWWQITNDKFPVLYSVAELPKWLNRQGG